MAELEFNRLTGLNLLIQPYRGTAPALNDVAGGHVQLMIDPVLALLPLAKSKHVKGLAVTSAKRTPLAPEYPTASESGLGGMDHSSWYGIWGPKKLSRELVAQLNKAINEAVQELKREGQLAKARNRAGVGNAIAVRNVRQELRRSKCGAVEGVEFRGDLTQEHGLASRPCDRGRRLLADS